VGAVEASLLEVVSLSKLYRGKPNVSLATEDLFDAGEVDDELLSPTCYRSDLNAGDLMALLLQGGKVFAHSFKAKGLGRKSTSLVYEAS
jgi:hypothetical protein